MISKTKILQLAQKRGKIRTSDIVKEFHVSRQYIHRLTQELVENHALIKIGTTRSAFYVLLEYAKKHQKIFPFRYAKTFPNVALQEDRVFEQVRTAFPPFKKLPENIQSIFTYGFSEMLNNAIEHSESKNIRIKVALQKKILSFCIDDVGVGVFRNIMQKRKLHSELEAIQDLLKGKTTTMPKSHSGEGIFFTSKVCDLFILESFGHQLIVNNEIPDVFVSTEQKIKNGTRVVFQIKISSQRHLNDVFSLYTNIGAESDYGFDKTEIRVKLYTVSGIHISRSQARRILSGLEKFKIIIFDFEKVPLVGQAFADEIFRVFQNKNPHIRLETENMNDGVKFMIERAKNEAKIPKS
ncbi:DUF4325 domain-containing protein [Candidatus Peregrinibacteria bacterium]|nr:DUF4325 domain-containing protein [Candidatus Peregrinibacteria bacterium]